MPANHSLRHWAAVALCLVTLLVACGSETAPAEDLRGTTSGAGTASPQTAPPTAAQGGLVHSPLPTSPAAPTTLPTHAAETTSGQTAATTVPANRTAAPTSAASLTAALAARPSPTPFTAVVPVVPQPAPTSTVGPVTGEVPEELLEAIFKDAEERTGIARGRFTLLRAEAITWPDGAMGCPQPGMRYTQAEVPGYWVELGVDDQELDYHASKDGYFFLCEKSSSL